MVNLPRLSHPLSSNGVDEAGCGLRGGSPLGVIEDSVGETELLELPCCAGSSKARSDDEKITVAVCFDSCGVGGSCVYLVN